MTSEKMRLNYRMQVQNLVQELAADLRIHKNMLYNLHYACP